MNSVIHLTEEQIDDHLIGERSLDVTAHLAACKLCQARAAEIGSAISNFKEVTLAWGERQSATMPVRVRGVKSTPAPGTRAIWAATAAAALITGIAVPIARHESANRAAVSAIHVPPTASQSFALQREAQIAEDNQMMQAIDREISSSVSSPSETFGIEVGGNSQRIAHTATVQD